MGRTQALWRAAAPNRFGGLVRTNNSGPAERIGSIYPQLSARHASELCRLLLKHLVKIRPISVGAVMMDFAG